MEASDFFRTMFGLPQPACQSGSAKGKGKGRSVGGAGMDGENGEGDGEDGEPPEERDIPRIDMQEPASVLIPLLTLLYPVTPPSFPSLAPLPELFRAAHKYDLPLPLAHLRSVLLEPRFLHSDPLAVYALACQFGLAEEARAASRQTLKVDLMSLLLPMPDKLGQMLAVDLVQLVALRVARASQAKALLKSPTLLQGMKCSCGSLPPWVGEWRRRACQELDRYPVSETVFGSAFLGEVVSLCGVSCGKCGMARWDKEEWERLRAEVDGLLDTI